MMKEFFIKLKNGNKLKLPKPNMTLNCIYCFYLSHDLNLQDIDDSDSNSAIFKEMVLLNIQINNLLDIVKKEKGGIPKWLQS